jgi:hypothetical protein
VDEVALGQIFLPALPLSAVSIIPPMIHNNSFTHPSLMLSILHEHKGDSFVITTVVSSVRQKHHFYVSLRRYMLQVLTSTCWLSQSDSHSHTAAVTTLQLGLAVRQPNCMTGITDTTEINAVFFFFANSAYLILS